jgi:hypothetical protein
VCAAPEGELASITGTDAVRVFMLGGACAARHLSLKRALAMKSLHGN